MKSIRKFWGGMDTMTRLLIVISLLLGAMVYPIYSWAADVTATGTMGPGPGGLPIETRWSHTNGTAEASYTVASPTGFIPDYVWHINDWDATNPVICEWYYGMGDADALVHTNGTVAAGYISSGGITVNATTGVITIDTGCTINSGNELGIARRISR